MRSVEAYHASQASRVRRGVGALAAVLGLVVGAPMLLIATSHARFGAANPVHDVPWPWQWTSAGLSDLFREPVGDATVLNGLLRTAVVVGWVALVIVVATTASEVVHLLRHRGIPMPERNGLRWCQPIARTIAAGIIALLPSTVSASTLGTSSVDIAVGALASDETGAVEIDSEATPPEIRIQRVDQTERHLYLEWDDGPSDEHTQSPTGPRIGANQMAHPAAGRVDVDPADLDRAHPDRADADRADADRAEVEYVVERGDSVYSIAARLADGDASRTHHYANAILDANLGQTMIDGTPFTNPALIRPGWTLVLPSELPAPSWSATTPPDAPATGDPVLQTVDEADEGAPVEEMHPDKAVADLPEIGERAPRATPSPPTPGRHTVEPGDTLVGIAHDVLDDPHRWGEIWDLNRGRTMRDGRVFDDPHLIVSGWDLVLPGDRPARVDEQPIQPAAPTEHEPSERRAEPSHAVDDNHRPDAAHEDVADETAAAPTAPAEATTIDRPVDTTSGATPGRDREELGNDEAEQVRTTPAPAPIGFGAAGILAAGILAAVAVRRRRRMRGATVGARLPVPVEHAVATERQLRQIDQTERLARLDVALRAAAKSLTGQGARVGLVRLTPNDTIVLRLTAGADLPAPWHTVGDRREWRLSTAVDLETLADAARHAGAPCPALVQLGVDLDDAVVLVDIEAAHVLRIDSGDDQHDRAVLTGIAAGLAVSPNAEAAHFVTVELPLDPFVGHANAHRARNTRGAIELATQLTDGVASQELSTPATSTFERRTLRTGGSAWPPGLVLFGPDDDLDDTDLSSIPESIGVVVCGAASAVNGEALLTVGPSGTAAWRLSAFGVDLTMTPVGMDSSDVADVGRLLADAETLPLPPDTPPDAPPPAPIADHRPIGDDPAEPIRSDRDPTLSPPADQTPPRPSPPHPTAGRTHRIVVRLLGPVDVIDRTGASADFARSKTLELVAWLATHRDGATRGRARAALWAVDVRDATFSNVVSDARRSLARLVPTGDGDWIGRTLNDQLPLHPDVVSDADLVTAAMTAATPLPPADAVDVLRPAVEFVRGIPFSDTNYLWPDAEGTTSNLVLLATSAATMLAECALELGDIDTVFWATGRGLAILNGQEELIGLRMRALAARGDLAALQREWEGYERSLAAESWSNGEPSAELVQLRRDLLGV